MNKVAFIAGCFDKIHSGHLFILAEMAKLGQVIVAINRDEYLARKGPGRPLRNLEQRTQDLYNTGLVSEVIHIEDSPLEIIKFLRPDYIVVGDDYTEDRVVGAKECSTWNGQVKIVKRIPGFSTTQSIS